MFVNSTSVFKILPEDLSFVTTFREILLLLKICLVKLNANTPHHLLIFLFLKLLVYFKFDS